MMLTQRTLRLPCLLLAATCAAHAADKDDVLVVHQTYTVARVGNKEGESKDVRQVLYMTKDGIRIDEFDGASSDVPSETTLVNLKTETIVRIAPEGGQRMKVTQTFFDRRQRMDNLEQKASDDIKDHPKNKAREELIRYHRALLASKKDLRLGKDESEARDFEGVRVVPVVVTDKEFKNSPPIKAWFNSKIVLPYDSAEVLYLLQLTGKGTKLFLDEHKEEFRFLPMAMELRLPAGGHLSTRVTQVERRARDEVTGMLRQQLGANADFDNDFLAVAEKIEERPVRVPPVAETPPATTVDPD